MARTPSAFFDNRQFHLAANVVNTLAVSRAAPTRPSSTTSTSWYSYGHLPSAIAGIAALRARGRGIDAVWRSGGKTGKTGKPYAVVEAKASANPTRLLKDLLGDAADKEGPPLQAIPDDLGKQLAFTCVYEQARIPKRDPEAEQLFLHARWLYKQHLLKDDPAKYPAVERLYRISPTGTTRPTATWR